jgi:hypothetical protein
MEKCSRWPLDVWLVECPGHFTEWAVMLVKIADISDHANSSSAALNTLWQFFPPISFFTSPFIIIFPNRSMRNIFFFKLKSKLLYDWRFTANQFVLAPGPFRPTTRDSFFQLNSCGNIPYVTSTDRIENIIVACVFVSAGRCLPGRCLAMDVSFGSIIPAFTHHITLFCGLCNNPISTSDNRASNNWTIVNNELESTWEEEVVAWFKALSWNLRYGSVETTKNINRGSQCPGQV